MSENKLLRAHLDAAYAEIGKLKVKLIEASLCRGGEALSNTEWEENTLLQNY